MKRIEFRFLFLSLFCILLGQWPRFQLWRRKGEDLLSPFRFGSYRASKSVSDVVSFWFTVGNLAEENAQLRKKVGDLEAFQAEIELLRVENDQLRDQVGLARRAGGELVAARVSGWEPFSNRRLMVIDKGSQEGIKVGLPVLVGNSLLGKVVAVGKGSSKVQLIFDNSVRIHGRNSSPGSDATGVVRGFSSNRLLMEKILLEEKIAQGDKIVTSGEGGNYPSGLVLGFVERVEEQSDLLKQAFLKSSIDFSHLDDVFVLLL